MNKQEAIKKMQSEARHHCGERECYKDGCTKNVELDIAIDIVNQIDEPEKPVVPQFVADFYESIEDDFESGVYELCAQFYEDESELSDGLYWWFKFSANKPIQTLVNMHKFGYEVEKEKLYTAKLKLTGEYLVYYASIKDLHHDKTTDNAAKRRKVYHFTEDDLVKYHIWGNNAYEVKEVEE